MGEYSETFTIDVYHDVARELCAKYLRGFGYKLIKDFGGILSFEKGSMRKNLFTFSFEEAYKHVIVSIVGTEDAPVSTISVSFSLPFLNLRRGDVNALKSMIRAMREFIIVTVGYSRTSPITRRSP